VDLTRSNSMHLLRDGRGVVPVWAGDHGGDLWLFDALGSPSRVLARGGAGPGEMAGTASLFVAPGDTIYMIDGLSGFINRYTADSGFLGGTRGERVPRGCMGPISRLTDGRHVGVDGCGQARRLPDGSLNPMVALYMIAADFTTHDSIAAVPGNRMRLVDMTMGGRTSRGVMSELMLGHRTTAAAVDSAIVVGSGDGGYVLDLRSANGATIGRIVVERPAVVMSDDIRNRLIEASVAQAVASGNPNFTAERAREMAASMAFADTVAAYGALSSTDGGTLWVRDTRMPGDTSWSATAFGRDGSILGRLSLPQSLGRLTWLGDDRVMVRHEDEDGVVRFGVYEIVEAPAGQKIR
jgi:hypothetical protein